MDGNRISYDNYICKAREFVAISNKLCDDWKLYEHKHENGTLIKKESFKELLNSNNKLTLKAEYLISYNVSYEVPIFSFNYWNERGVLLTLDEIRELSLIQISKEDFYSVITQQEHPILFRPFFTIHPCHTGSLLANFKQNSKNIIITFLSLVAPLLQLKLPLEYAV